MLIEKRVVICPSDKYEIWCNETLIASNMNLSDALLFCKAVFNEYFYAAVLNLKIKRMETVELGEQDESNISD